MTAEYLFNNIKAMSIAEIENEIKKLPFEKVDELTAWFSDYHAQLWDR